MEDSVTADTASKPSRPRSAWRPVALAILSLLIGAVVGAYLMQRHCNYILSWVVAMYEESMADQFTELQYKEGRYPEAREALERYARFLLDPAPSANPLSDMVTRRRGAVLTYSRLALLHERNGHPELAADAWSKAESLARDWRHPDREHLRLFAQRVDANVVRPIPIPTPKAGA